jgi:hypothetical protein
MKVAGFAVIILLFSASAIPSSAQCARKVEALSHGELRVAPNGRYLQHRDGTPFFYLADTAWELFHRLDRKDTLKYLDDRACNGFNVIQAVALAEYDGLNVANMNGDKPLIGNNPERPNDTYFKHVDWVIEQAARRDMYIALLPTWGDKVVKMWGIGPVIFNPQNARVYGRWLGKRYANTPNLIWMLGGDRPAKGFEDVWRAMATGIKEGGAKQLMTYHPSGGSNPLEWFNASDTWLDFIGFQSGHSRRDIENYRWITLGWNSTPTRPVIDLEPRYEDHPINWDAKLGYFDGSDVRQAQYWAVFAGAAGVTYGAHPIWQFYAREREPNAHVRHTWEEALLLPGAKQLRHLRDLILRWPYFMRIPDDSIVVNNANGEEHIRATRDAEGTYALIYVPTGKPFEIRTSWAKADRFYHDWFDPRTGRRHPGGSYRRHPTLRFSPPTSGRGEDWVLVLYSSRNWPTSRILDTRASGN